MTLEAQVISFAGEGVPIGCIARAFRLDRGRLRMILEDALGRGLIAELPAADWLGTRFDDRSSLGAAPVGEALAKATRAGVLLNRYGLAGRMADLLLALVDREFLPIDEAIDRFTGTGSNAVLRKQVTEIRRAAAKDKVQILNKYGSGYHLSPPSRERLANVFARCGCE